MTTTATADHRTAGDAEYKFGFSRPTSSRTPCRRASTRTSSALISAKKDEPEWMLEWRLKAYRHWLTMKEPHLGQRRTTRRSTTRRSVYYSAPKSMKDGPKSLDEVDPEILRPTRSSASRCASRRSSPASRSTRCSTSVSVATTFKAKLRRGRHHLLLVLRGGARAPRAGARSTSASVVPLQRQLLRHAQLGGVLRRLVRLRAQGRALPDGALDLLPHQRQEHRPVRAHADHRRRGRLRLLPRGLHRADARREPAPRRGGRAGGARERADQVLDGAELVPGRQGGQGRHLQLRHQARQVRGARARRSRGPRSRPARRSPGSTRA